MPRTRPSRTSPPDRLESLRALLAESEADLTRLQREEEYLSTQTKRAREQVRYYERLLSDLKREWGKTPPLTDLVRKLGRP